MAQDAPLLSDGVARSGVYRLMCPDDNVVHGKLGGTCRTKVVENITLKLCSSCGSWLPIECFNKRPANIYGKRYPRPHCKYCERIAVIQKRAKEKIAKKHAEQCGCLDCVGW